MLPFCQLHSVHRIVCNAVAWIALAAALGVPPAFAADPAEFPLSDVQKGQTGYGLSVFSGAEIDRFEVEILGVWQNLQPKTSYVLARLSGQGLEDSGVIAGMSGSPVYVEGKLVGAVSFGWPFSKEPIAGITPVEHMRALFGQTTPEPGGRLQAGRSPEAPAFAPLVGAAFDEADLRRGLVQLRPPSFGEAPAAVEWAVAGFGPRVRSLLGEELGAVAAAGSSTGVSTDLVPGSAVAAVLVDGDLRLAATGTVTDRRGDAIVAFGHPFLGMGHLEVPMAGAEVVTVVSSQLNSFKIANLGPVVGAVDFDFLTGIRGTVGKQAPTIPMTVRVDRNQAGSREGAAGKDHPAPVRLSLANLPMLTPTLAAISVLGSLNATVESAGVEGLDMNLAIDLGEHGRLTIAQSFDGRGSEMSAALHLMAMAGYVMQNALEEVTVHGITVDLSTHREPRTLSVIGAHPSRSVVRPGESIQLNVDLAAYRGERVRKVLEVSVPSNAQAGRYTLLVGDGQSIDGVRLTLEQFDPVSFDQALDYLNSLHSTSELRVLGLGDGPGLAVAGEVLPDLPGSVSSLWRASGSGGARPLRTAVVEEAGIALGQPAEGLLRVDLEVERGEPVQADPRRRGEQTGPQERAPRGSGGKNGGR